MNFMMAGMAPVMSFLMMGSDMRAMEPTELLFWGVMSLGVIVGFITAYPSNVWMVARGLKHGLMTQREQEFDKAGEGKRARAHASSEAGATGHHHDEMKRKPETMKVTPGHGAHARSREHANPGHDGPDGGGGNQKHGPHGGHGMESDATVPQLAAVSGVSMLALALGMVAPANWVNLTLSARDVGGAIMPPGMIMDRDTPAEAMLDMAAVHPRLISASYGLDVRGDRELEPRMENGVKVFNLETSVIRWAILPDVKVDAYAINGQVPGPRLHIRQGDRVRINVTNRLPESTTIHWHGLILPNEMDGPAEITQEPIPPGGSYGYEFTAGQSGTYFYHSHDHVDRQQGLGLYGALIIDPANAEDEIPADHDYVIQLQEWLMREVTAACLLPPSPLRPFFRRSRRQSLRGSWRRAPSRQLC